MLKWQKIKERRERWKGLRRKKLCRERRDFFVRITRCAEYGWFSFCNSWNWRFSMLNSRYDTYMREIRQVSYKVPAYKHPRLSREFFEDLLEARSKGLFAEKWKIFSPRRRVYFWFDVILKFLEDHPRNALEVLKATFIKPYPPGYAIADSLDYMVSYFLSNPDNSFAEGDAIVNAFDYFLTNGPKDHIHFFQRTIYRSMGLLDAQNLEKLYSIFVAADHPLHENTLLQLGTQLAKLGRLKTASKILQQLKDQGCDFGASKIMSFCSTLLRQTTQDETGEIHCTVMLIFGAGLKPNINIYNILLENELRLGEQEAAWELHDIMKESGVPPDEYTYSLLLNHSKVRMDLSGIRRVIDYVRRSDVKNSLIMTDILHAIFLLHRQERQHLDIPSSPPEQHQPVFDRLLPVYSEHFNVEPLARIIPNFANRYPSLDKTRSADSQALLKDPPAPTLVVMITAFLDGIKTSLPVKQFYDQFRVLVSNQDPVVAPLMQTTHLWNLVLISFSKFPNSLGDCSTLIGDMLSPPDSIFAAPASCSLNKVSDGVGSQLALVPGKAAAFHGPSGSLPGTSLATFSPPKPDVFTWSILLRIFMDLRQPLAAEKILTMMRQTGVEPSIVTWNKLVHGYANLQGTYGAASAVARLQEAGMQPDEFTFKALSKIRDRSALISELKKEDAAAVEIAFVRDLKDDLKKYLECKVPEYMGGVGENDTWYDDLFTPKEEE
ncbi:pentatricopeptide repeat protein [Diplocarpon rosae]|nr:pentatricopeptide repeat protein [Diplocarpon rosae]